MTSFQPARRDFLQLLSGTAGAAWLAANLPAIVVAAEHARQAVRRPNPPLEVLTADQAQELDAITSRLIPTDDVAGAHEAGVVFFIDRALKTFASDSLPEYRKGLTEIQERTTKRFPGVASFSAATPEQQDKILAELFAESENKDTTRRLEPSAEKSAFIETLRIHTIFGYLVDPEGGGNRDFVGWKAIGRDPAHMFSPPFGFYDKDYPGWQPAPAETDKK
jgi:gluconate 2-dehydrogenase gamma chain